MSTPVLFAAVAALLFAAGNNLQRHAAAKVPVTGHGPVRLIRRLLHSPRWLTGGLCAVGGFACQAKALTHGGVILVQAVIASALVYSLIMESVVERRRPAPVQMLGAGLVVGGILLLVGIGHPVAGRHVGSLWHAAPAWVAAAVVGGGALLRARLRPKGRRTAIVLGSAAGTCFALDAVFLRGLAATLPRIDPVTVGTDVAGFAAASVLGNLAVQRGFQLAPLRHVLPAMSATEPVAAFACGWIIYGERLQPGLVGTVAVVGGLLLMVTGVVLCAAREPAPRPAAPPASSAASPGPSAPPASSAPPAQTE